MCTCIFRRWCLVPFCHVLFLCNGQSSGRVSPTRSWRAVPLVWRWILARPKEQSSVSSPQDAQDRSSNAPLGVRFYSSLCWVSARMLAEFPLGLEISERGAPPEVGQNLSAKRDRIFGNTFLMDRATLARSEEKTHGNRKYDRATELLSRLRKIPFRWELPRSQRRPLRRSPLGPRMKDLGWKLEQRWLCRYLLRLI
jgi:hypothetical protein